MYTRIKFDNTGKDGENSSKEKETYFIWSDFLQVQLITKKIQLFLFIYFNQLYMFRAMFSPIIRIISLQLYVEMTLLAGFTHTQHQPAATFKVNKSKYLHLVAYQL